MNIKRVILMVLVLAHVAAPSYGANAGISAAQGAAATGAAKAAQGAAATIWCAISDWLCPPVYAADKGADPVAHWRFDEGGGATAYDNVGANDGTLQPGDASGSNDTVGEMWSTQGKLGGAFECDGLNDHIRITSVSALKYTGGDLALSAWVKIDSSESTGGDIVSKPWNGSGQYNYRLILGSNTTVNFSIYGAAGSCSVTTTDTLSKSVWHHVAVSVTGSTKNVKIYFDGKLVKEATHTITDYTPAAGDSNTSLSIATLYPYGGAWAGNTGYSFHGLIDDVRIYNYARTAAQVMVDYNLGTAAHFGSGTDPNEGNAPVGYWDFEKLGADANSIGYDKSGNGNNGTITGATQVAGKHGKALSFDGNDYVNCGNNSSLDVGTSDFSISMFIKSTATASQRGVIQKVAYWTAGFSVVMNQSTVGNIGINFGTATGGNGWYVSSDNAFNDGAWHHLGIVVKRATQKVLFYKDGKLDVERSMTLATAQNLNTVETLKIGYYSYFFDGQIDQVKIYNYARTQAQIAYDYNKGAPVAHYKFDEGTGSIAHNEYSRAGSGTAAPVGWWRMDNDWNTSSGGGYNGSATGATFSSSAKIGPYAGNFDGNDYVTISSSPISNTDDLTIELWVNANAATGIWSTFVASQSFRFSISAADKIAMSWTDGSSSAHLYSGTDFSLGVWHHVAVAKSGTNYTFYIDGVQSGAVGSTAYSRTITSLEIGRDTLSGIGGVDYITGQIDDVRTYNYARTAEQIYNDYKNTHGTMVGDTKFVDGKIGKALEFDGTGDYVSIPYNSSLNMTSSFTLSAWVYPKSIGANKQRIIDTAIDGSTTGQQYCLKIGTSSPYTDMSGFVAKSGTSYETKSTTGYITQNTWQHVAYIYDSSTGQGRIYHNGKEVSYAVQQTATAPIDTLTQGINIGLLHYASESYLYGDQKVDDVRIYNYARTAAQVMQDYNAGMSAHTGVATGVKDPWGRALPVAHWKLNENTGVLARDASENNNDGTLGGDGAGTDVPTWTHGKHGPGLSFDGGDYVYSPNTTSLQSTLNYVTASAWIYPTSLGVKVIVEQWYPDNGWLLGINGSGNIYANLVTSSTSNTNWLSNSTISVDSWHYITFVYDGAKEYLYIDGNLDNTFEITGTIVNGYDNPVYIGANAVNAFFVGQIDDVKIYNYARTQAEIAWDYNHGKPVGYWRMDEKVAGQAVDITAGAIKDDSDHDNDGTASNTTWAAYATGKFGSALSFDGGDRVDCGTNLPESTERTYAWWHKISANGAAIFPTPISYGGYSNGFRVLWRDDSDDKVDVQITTGSDTTPTFTLESTVVDQVDVWYHYAFTYDGVNTGKLYRNGVLVDTKTNGSGAIKSTASSFLIGLSQYYWKGLIDDVRAYNYVRTADQVMQDYNAGLAGRLGD